jgi:transcriptional regulator with XRE-family HTH domain
MADLIPDLRAQREARGWTVGDLARRSATSDLTIRTIENGGRGTPEAVDRIQAALRVRQSAPMALAPPVSTKGMTREIVVPLPSQAGADPSVTIAAATTLEPEDADAPDA